MFESLITMANVSDFHKIKPKTLTYCQQSLRVKELERLAEVIIKKEKWKPKSIT